MTVVGIVIHIFVEKSSSRFVVGTYIFFSGIFSQFGVISTFGGIISDQFCHFLGTDFYKTLIEFHNISPCDELNLFNVTRSVAF